MIQQHKKDGEVIVMMDANSRLTEKHMEQLLTKTNMYDMMGYKHNTHTPTTYIRGTNTIDFIIATANVLPTICKAGMLGFNDTIQSDHRGLWLDLNYKQMSYSPEKASPIGHYIPTTKHIVHYTQLKTKCTEIFETSQIKEKLAALKHNIATQSSEQSISDLNHIDTLVDKAMLQPLRQITPPTSAWWSPSLQDGIYLLQYWKLCGTERALGIDFTNQKTSIRAKLTPTLDIYQNYPGAMIQKQIRLARANLSQLKQHSFDLRQQHLEQRAEHYATNKDRQKETVLKQMKLAEYMSHMYKKIRRYLKPSSKQTLHKIQSLSTDRTMTIHTNQEDMEQILLRHHQSHFHQAHGTPFTVDPLQSFFGLSTESPNRVKFRNHQIDPSTIPLPEKEITDFLHVLCPSPMDPPPLDVNITMENIKHGFRLWRETTSTSPKGRKLSLYKMWLDEPGTDTIMSGNEFFTVILDLILLAQRLQVPLSRWKTVHNLFILKKPNDYRPERLRALHQIDAELNLIRRELIAKRLLRHAEEYQYLKDHNYGGRNGKCANDVVMKKYLTLQIWHLQRHNGALTDCDAKSCYDRIIPILLYLSYSKAGLPHSTCLWLCQCLINMEYHIVTVYSASSDTSTSSDTHPLYGIGQGATDAPSGWLLVSTILSRYYDSKAIGCTLVDPTGYLTLRWTHVMFVDDTYLIHSTGDPKASLSTIEQVVQHDSSTWNMGLHITGGKLEGSKSKYLVLIWTFLQNGIPALETHDNNNNPVQLHLYNQSQEQLK